MKEIKAIDIMIGNYVIFEQTTHIVVEVSETLVATRWIKGNDKYIHTFPELKPIPLTEDVLLKAGFKKNEFGVLPTFRLDRLEISLVTFYDEDANGIGFNFSEWKLSGVYGDDLTYFKSSPSIKYLHELQNLVRCLTKTELIVEL